jgi:hypothetical protein
VGRCVAVAIQSGLSNTLTNFSPARRYTAPYAEVVRAELILLAAEGINNEVTGQKLDMPRQVSSNWRKRFYLNRLEGLVDHVADAPLISPHSWSWRQKPSQ